MSCKTELSKINLVLSFLAENHVVQLEIQNIRFGRLCCLYVLFSNKAAVPISILLP